MANSAKDQFMAALKPQLRTPLTPVLLASARWRTTRASPPEGGFRDELADDPPQHTDRGPGLIDDLLDLHRIGRGQTAAGSSARRCPRAAARTLGFSARSCRKARRSSRWNWPRPTHASTRRAPASSKSSGTWSRTPLSSRRPPQHQRFRSGNRGGDAAGRLFIRVPRYRHRIESQVLPRIIRGLEQGRASDRQSFGGLGLGLNIARAIVKLASWNG